MKVSLALCLALLSLTSCATFEAKLGHFTIISSDVVHKKTDLVVIQPRVAAGGCWSHFVESAHIALPKTIEEALARVTGATALVLVKIEDEGQCFRVEGLAARPR